MEKKVYEAPEAVLVRFDFTDRIAGSGACDKHAGGFLHNDSHPDTICLN